MESTRPERVRHTPAALLDFPHPASEGAHQSEVPELVGARARGPTPPKLFYCFVYNSKLWCHSPAHQHGSTPAARREIYASEATGWILHVTRVGVGTCVERRTRVARALKCREGGRAADLFKRKKARAQAQYDVNADGILLGFQYEVMCRDGFPAVADVPMYHHDHNDVVLGSPGVQPIDMDEDTKLSAAPLGFAPALPLGVPHPHPHDAEGGEGGEPPPMEVPPLPSMEPPPMELML
ncbi:hypothetical protein FB451DRAFT_1554079 [Mycena latifolia]|nr:hypothetical protein FB451DRAFT_1554079 [Mycena latifolia]